MHAREGTLASLRLRWSLVIVWLWTGIVSLIEIDGQSRDLLAHTGLGDRPIQALIVSGAAVDIVLGLLMAIKPSRLVYICALGLMVVMTIVATITTPSLWLHPLGPLTKNIPIAACLLALMQFEKTRGKID